MNPTGLMSGIGAGILAIVFSTYLRRGQGAQRSRRYSIVFAIAGAMFFVIGFFFLVAVKVIPELEEAGTLLVTIAITFLLFGAASLAFCRVFKSIRELQEKATQQSPSEKEEMK